MNPPTLKFRQLSEKLSRQYDHLQALIHELYQKAAAKDLDAIVVPEVESLNALPSDVKEKEFQKQLYKRQASILQKVEKNLKIVPKEYYKNQWLALGMATFGIPIGVAFAMAIDNMALFAIGLPIGMAIGIANGVRLDNKAKGEGRQLDLGVNPA